MKQLDNGFELIMRGMEVIGKIVGDPPNDNKEDEKDNPKSDHPSTFRESLYEYEGGGNASKQSRTRDY